MDQNTVLLNNQMLRGLHLYVYICNVCKEKGTYVRFINTRTHEIGRTFDPFGTNKCNDPSSNRSCVVKLKT